MKLVNTEYRNNDADQFHIGFLAQTVDGIVVDECLGNATLVRNDSVHGVHDRSGNGPEF